MKYQYTRRPYDFQISALKRIYRSKRLLLWFDPGEGKSKVAIDFIAAMLYYEKIKRALIIAPLTAVFGVWEEQLELDAPHLSYHILRPDGWDGSLPNNVPLILTNYDFFSPRLKPKRHKRTGELIEGRTRKDSRVLDALIDWEPDVVVLDESHRIKNPQSRAAKASYKLGPVAEYAICLTGTPEGNKRVLDLWSPMHFLDPDLLEPTFSDFKQVYAIPQGFGGFEIKKFRDLPKLAERVHPYLMIQKAKIKHEPRHITVRVDLPIQAKELYKKMEHDFVVEIEKKTVIASIVLAQLQKLSQMTGGFIRTNEGQDILVHRAKLEALQELLEDLHAADVKRVVIFARFTWEIAAILAVCKTLRWPVYEMSGRTEPVTRKLAVSLFNSGGGAMVCQIATGSASLNLQAARYAIFYSVDYSLINYTQALARLRPQLQTASCFYYHLKCKGTIDNRLYNILDQNKSADHEFRELVKGIKEDANLRRK